MASRNSVKIYTPDSYFHVYNRGVEQRNIFQDEQDFSVFLSYVQTYITPKDNQVFYDILTSPQSTSKDKDTALKMINLKNYYLRVQLICYALLPNHFHMLLYQREPVINGFMNSLGTRYAMYFNRKYKRKGVLFQDVYKAVQVDSDEQLLYLSQYIHTNPVKAVGIPIHRWEESPYPSSLPEYLGLRNTDWISKECILDYFSKTNPGDTYEKFLGIPMDLERIANSAIDIESE
ncbi:hypothetical protein A3D77_03070 [Candidatus Gottesmanbacteria bacterium RIFCSPHIGHO2_02_FULL_39_11]|uniref:Transposase IS200-like domain-containing protein n=1 Tax=Candidatus Gottesmanbacteria bacterium RIFCSPHIGHO2_02_FULL_39_11 TaxID=1798382 RepID=A0A1F5ZLQ5_9BACT|nr:MAG: hypothetical protein A3D77_03070 [Candidatus Gottesmanbacteria bacterium RIFCSPHIGHO2_02_FULL_39_11]